MFSSLRYSFAFAYLLAPSAGAAQQTVDVASVSGRVVDATGATVPGAQITSSHSTPTSSTAVTDQGRFRFPICASASTS